MHYFLPTLCVVLSMNTCGRGASFFLAIFICLFLSHAHFFPFVFLLLLSFLRSVLLSFQGITLWVVQNIVRFEADGWDVLPFLGGEFKGLMSCTMQEKNLIHVSLYQFPLKDPRSALGGNQLYSEISIIRSKSALSDLKLSPIDQKFALTDLKSSVKSTLWGL